MRMISAEPISELPVSGLSKTINKIPIITLGIGLKTRRPSL